MKNTAHLRRIILSRQASISVVGQGYVGLNVACAAAEEGFFTTGFDINPTLISQLQAGVLSVAGVADKTFRTGISSRRLQFTSEPSSLSKADIVLIAVPTPVRDHTPDLSFVEGACKQVAAHLSPGRLVILESTTYPGTSDELVRPLLEANGLQSGRDFLLAYSPERIDPGNDEYGIRNTPRIVGGLTPEASGIACLFYEQLVEKVVVVSSCRAAEMAKLLENTFRHVNVGLANETAMLCHEMGVDVWEVLAAAATKPFGYMSFHPGPGVGGHCIPLDPTYLAWHVRRAAGHQFRILEQAQDINAQMPAYVGARIGEALNEEGKPLKGAHVFVLGVSYKPDVGDVRESPSIRVIEHLRRRGAVVGFHDPFVESLSVNGVSMARTELTNRAIAAADCVAVLTPHSAYDLEWIADHARLVFDARDAYAAGHRTNVVPL